MTVWFIWGSCYTAAPNPTLIKVEFGCWSNLTMKTDEAAADVEFISYGAKETNEGT